MSTLYYLPIFISFTYIHVYIPKALFSPKGSNMAIPHPLILKFILTNTVLQHGLNFVDQTSYTIDTLPHL